MTELVIVAIISAVASILTALIATFNSKTAKSNSAKLDELKVNTATNHGKRLGEHVEAMSQDITEVKRAIDSLWLLLDTLGGARFATYIELVPEAIFIYDKTGMITMANDAARKLLGMTLLEMQQDGWLGSIHPDDRERIFMSTAQHREANRPFDEVYRIVRKDGAEVRVHGRGRAIYDHLGHITSFLCVLQPV